MTSFSVNKGVSEATGAQPTRIESINRAAKICFIFIPHSRAYSRGNFSKLQLPRPVKAAECYKIKTLMSLTKQQALDLFRSDDLIGIGMEADAVRRKHHPEGVVTYIIDRNINYTNFCTEYCTFCAFYAPVKGPGKAKGLWLDFKTTSEKIREPVELGGTGVLMQGGLHPDLKLEWYEDMLRGIKQRFPKVHLHCFSASEIIHFAVLNGLSIRDTIARLRDAGLDSIPRGGAEILDDEVRHKIARLKCLTQDWLNVHRTAHQLGMRTTATMMFGVGEKLEHRVNHFQHVYNLQEETGGFKPLIPRTFQPTHTALGGRHLHETTIAAAFLTL